MTMGTNLKNFLKYEVILFVSGKFLNRVMDFILKDSIFIDTSLIFGLQVFRCCYSFAIVRFFGTNRAYRHVVKLCYKCRALPSLVILAIMKFNCGRFQNFRLVRGVWAATHIYALIAGSSV